MKILNYLVQQVPLLTSDKGPVCILNLVPRVETADCNQRKSGQRFFHVGEFGPGTRAIAKLPAPKTFEKNVY